MARVMINDDVTRFFNSALKKLQPGPSSVRFIQGKYDWYFNIEIYTTRPISSEFKDWAVHNMGMTLGTKKVYHMGSQKYRTFLTVKSDSDLLKVINA